ncbi:MAG: hypothetical protein IMZ61_10260 [Planctomycetes bacterium]|nr:hypothetical protein [Planctomycetota bacterium]
MIKLHYGHYFEGLFQSYFTSTETSIPDTIIYRWNGTDWVERSRTIFNADSYGVDPNFRQPFIREIVFGYERELSRDASLSISFYYRKVARFFGMINLAADWERMTVPNPGPDGIVGTSDDNGQIDVYNLVNPGASQFLITNPRKGQSEALVDDPKLTTKGFEIMLNKRFSKRWQMIASYNYTKTSGNAEGVFDAKLAGGGDPNLYVNAAGENNNRYGQPHQFKIQGSFLLPMDISIGVVGRYLSGRPKNEILMVVLPGNIAYVNGVPVGTSKYDPTKRLDIKLEKNFNIMGGRLTLMADVFNVFNDNQITGVYSYYGSLFNKIMSITTPRRYTIGFRIIY